LSERDISDAERVIRSLYGITSNFSVGFPAQLRELLSLGCERLGLSVGIISHVVGDQYTVVESAGPPQRPGPGTIFALSDTYCEITLEADQPTGFHAVGESEANRHPCYSNTGLEAYIGAPIRNRNGVFGTINFSSVDKHAQPFRDVDLDVMRLMATWIGSELEKTVETLHGMIPICSSCKCIRSNMGDWQALENYLTEQAHLTFTHGICPSCAEKIMSEAASKRAVGAK